MAQDDLLGLGLIVVIAGGAFYLLTQKGNFNLGPDANADEPGFTEGGVVDPSDPDLKKSCSQLCQAGLCAVHAAKSCSGCSKCPNSGGTSSQCSAWCKASNCTQYRTQCNGNCSNCIRATNCKACPHNYVRSSTAGCGCKPKPGTNPQTFGPIQPKCPAGYELRPRTDHPSEMGCYPINSSFARAYTGRVTFNESAPIANPNSIPMSTYKPAPMVPKPAMRARLY